MIVCALLLILIGLSGIFSGLTLGLMSLDEGFLNILLNCRSHIQKEVKLLLLTFEMHDRDKSNFDIIDDIEEERIIAWLNELDLYFKEDRQDKINDIIKKISKVKAKQHGHIFNKDINNKNIDNEKESDIKKELKHYVETYWMGKYAESILPIRRNGNFLLVVILIGNVIVNNIISILLSNITSGAVGLLLSTAFIVIFGEICPQAFCNKYSLYIGHIASEPMRVVMCIFYVVAKPISMFVDCLVGDDIQENFSRN